jgi:hypothetical protein
MKTPNRSGTDRVLRATRAMALSTLGLCFCQVLLAQPGYRPLPPDDSLSRYYPEPPRGFRGGQPYECDLYARDNADWYARQRPGVGSGAVRGAIGGAVFGALVGGSKGARRGAVAGGGLGAVAAGARAREEREIAYRLAYDDCMLRFRR